MEKMTEVRRAFIGKHFSRFDSWCGSHDYIKVKDIKKRKNKTYELTGKNAFGSDVALYVDDNVIEALIKEGKKKDSGEIDHCIVSVEYEICE